MKNYTHVQKVSPDILWLGGVFQDKTIHLMQAVSPAANRWQLGLINSISEQGKDVEVVGHLPEPLWPKGRSFMNSNVGELRSNMSGQIVSYFNIPLVRNCTLRFMYKRALEKIINDYGLPKFIFSYNISPVSSYIGLLAQRKYGIPWVCVIADAPGQGTKQAQHQRLESYASGRIFLSWSRYVECQVLPKLHLDGGLDSLHEMARDLPVRIDKHIILYAGTLGPFGGVSLLVKAFRLVKAENVELWICGKGSNEEVKNASKVDQRIKQLGFVSEAKLKDIMEKATIFINPRPPLPDNYNNFPSKLFEYIACGKPIISTWTAGLNPQYRNILNIVESFNPEDLAKKIDEVLEWDHERYSNEVIKINEFAIDNCLWSEQTKNIINWLDHDVVLAKNCI